VKRQRSSPNPVAKRFELDPYFACLIFAGAGLGTLGLPTGLRLVLLWTTLLILWLVYREGQPNRLQYGLADLGRGLGIGLGVSVPLLILTYRPLATAVPILYTGNTERSMSEEASTVGTLAFVSLILLAPLAEELFFRDILHRERGFWAGTGLYAAAGVILFLPTAGQFFAVLVAVSGATTMLGILYGFLYERYGAVTTTACHATINLVLLFIPVTLNRLL